jgi:hypothetical protein
LTKWSDSVYNKCAEVNNGNETGIFYFTLSITHFVNLISFGGRTPSFTFTTTGIPLVLLLASATESGVKLGAFSFLPNRQAGPSADTLKPALTSTIGGPTVPAKNYLNIPPGNGQTSPTPESPADSLSLLLSLEEAEYTTDFLKQHIIELVCDLAGLLRRGCEDAAKALLDRIIELMEALAFWMKRLQRLEGVSNG